jgi:Domain of unknown function (DUF4314)
MPMQGDRVRLIHYSDPYMTIRPGTEGTVTFVDARGTVFVRWDDGRILGLVPGTDRWLDLEEER